MMGVSGFSPLLWMVKQLNIHFSWHCSMVKTHFLMRLMVKKKHFWMRILTSHPSASPSFARRLLHGSLSRRRLQRRHLWAGRMEDVTKMAS
jgi:hypothetical protein